MNHHYGDIRDRIPEPPVWWDEQAVPRYCAFSPDETANIYATTVVLAEIACQACGQLYRVAFSWHHGGPTTLEQVKQLHYGDPPNACGDCLAGATMNSEPRRVLEFWRRHDPRYTGPKDYGDGRPPVTVVTNIEKYFEWVRVPEFEVPLA